MTLALDLDPETLDRLSARAKQQGMSDPAAYAVELIKRDCTAADRSPGQEAVDRLVRARTNGMTADELMELTRSEV